MLLGHARRLKGALTVDVNEQNPEAVRFYEACGFAVVGRSEVDSDGRPFPLLHMREIRDTLPEDAMPEPASLIMLQFLDWVASRSRTYAETMEAWRTSCPRLSVWEDALIEGLIQIEGGSPQPALVLLTPRGRAILDARRIENST